MCMIYSVFEAGRVEGKLRSRGIVHVPHIKSIYYRQFGIKTYWPVYLDGYRLGALEVKEATR